MNSKYAVIFGHVGDTSEKVLFEGSKTACIKEIARRKCDAADLGQQPSKWCNGGFVVVPFFYVELREV